MEIIIDPEIKRMAKEIAELKETNKQLCVDFSERDNKLAEAIEVIEYYADEEEHKKAKSYGCYVTGKRAKKYLEGAYADRRI